MADNPSPTGGPFAGDPGATPILPAHIEATVEAISKLHSQHRRGATPTERLVERIAGVVGRPHFLAYLVSAMAVWVVGNLAAPHFGARPLDPPPFAWMEMAMTAAALLTTSVILVFERREDQLSNLREQLTLELAILSEQKTAKTIQLLEELRRDLPMIEDRLDHEAREMAQPADPEAVLSALTESEAQAALVDGHQGEAGTAGARP